MTLPLAGGTAVVTGASRGIGRAIALRLAGAGAELALWARDAEDLAVVVGEIEVRGGRARAQIVDVSDPRAVTEAAAIVRATMPPVRIVVNNAGSVIRKPTATLTDADWRSVMAVNLDGTFYVTRAFLADLTRAGGRIINISSIAGRQGTPLLAAYCAAKHGVVGFTRALAEELCAAKVSVNAICPGSVDTAMLREGMPDASPDMSPDDIARTALFLACEAPEALTGTCIDVFG
ncbi:MAG: SDR family oxidoreductase [Deltaproteobacteria bacterium]|nr:SDR family oxidoreductase [Deltaproteobacteria bacterium]MDQ3296600.1 SDR family oxidoreductase [Myxococcota bacterium]